MNPVYNPFAPFAPGAGTPPPELAGRTKLREQLMLALERARIGRPAKSAMLIGLRGVGKTVLLDRIREEAEKIGIHTVRIEAPEGRSLPALLAPEIRLALLRLSQVEAARDYAIRGLRALAGFVSKLRIAFKDIEVGLDDEPELGLADNSDLEHDLQALLEQLGIAAKAATTTVVILIDELQYVAVPQLAALITAMHRIEQRALPVVLVRAGLPQLRGQMGNAKSYAERLFDFPEIGPLCPNAAKQAIVKPLEKEGVEITDEAVLKNLGYQPKRRLLLATMGQSHVECGKHEPHRIIRRRKSIADCNCSFGRGVFSCGI